MADALVDEGEESGVRGRGGLGKGFDWAANASDFFSALAKLEEFGRAFGFGEEGRSVLD